MDREIPEPLAASDWLPVAYDHFSDSIRWKFVPGFLPNEAFLQWSLDAYELLNGPAKEMSTTTGELIDAGLIRENPLPPVLIFHLSRCGSTLLSNVLHRSSGFHVVSEPDVINGLLFPRYVSRNSSDTTEPVVPPGDQTLMKNLVGCLCGSKEPQRIGPAFLKLSSWNILFGDVFKAIFPRSPRIFVYREPGAVMASQLAAPAGFAELGDDDFSCFLCGQGKEEINAGSHAEYLAGCLSQMMQKALADPEILLINHSALSPLTVDKLLGQLGWPVDSSSRERMEACFGEYSKSKVRGLRYVDDTAAKLASLTDDVRRIVADRLTADYRRLEDSSRNIR